MFKEIENTGIEISEEGILRKISNGYIYKTYLDKDGYLSVRNSKLKTSRVSRIIYCVFNNILIEDLPSEVKIDHIDRDKGNNNPSNLRKVSDTQNNLNKESYSYKIAYNIISKKYYLTDNISKLALINGLFSGNLYKVLKKKTKQSNSWCLCYVNVIDDSYSDKIDILEEMDINSMKNILDKESYEEVLLFKKIRPNNKKTVVVATNTKNGKITIFANKRLYCEQHSLSKDMVLKVLNGKSDQYKGIKYEYDYNVCIELGGQILQFDSVKEFNDYLGRE